jgi:UDP-2-acetamido-2-deoxy-ribo-hexuluronate aminotransferase
LFMDLLLDTRWVVGLASGELSASWDAVSKRAKAAGARIWLYAGGVGDLQRGVAGLLGKQGVANPANEARVRIKAFAEGKHWLAALAGDVDLEADDPAGEQLLRAVVRFDGKCVVLTEDPELLARGGDRVMTPDAYAALPAKSGIPFINLAAQQDLIRADLERRIHRVLAHGAYINGPEVEMLETVLAQYTGTKHCVGVSSGTDALVIAMMALGIGAGDEVITTPFTFIATGEMIALLGARPVFVDIDPKTYNMDPALVEAAITPRTKAIVPVSLYGQCADMDAIHAVACKHGLPVIEDGAQSFGALYKGRKSCGLSLMGATSFFPSKPLGGYGDGGAIFTNDDGLAKAMREIREHGQDRRYHHPRIGLNGRLDALQAAVILAKLPIFDQERCDRVRVGNCYKQGLRDLENVVLPYVAPDNTSVYAQFTLQVPDRDGFIETLKVAGVPTAVHYPVPLHLQPVFAGLGQGRGSFPVAESVADRVVSLPMHPYMTEPDQGKIIEAVRAALSP